MATELKEIISERSVHLAIIYLTRRPDITVKRGSVADVIVDLKKTRDGRNRQFGVVTKGLQFAREVRQDGDEFCVSGVDLSSNRMNTLLYPVCLFVFIMENDCGYWKWLVQPVQCADGSFRLDRNDGAVLHRLDNAQITEIVDSVNQWYSKSPVAV